MNNNNNNSNKEKNRRKILTACIGQCVHVAGLYNFLKIADQLNFQCEFLGPATPISRIVNEIKRKNPEILGLSYRLTPKTVMPLLKDFKKQYKKLEKKPKRLFFAGTPEVVKLAKNLGIFDEYFIGAESRYDILSILKQDRDSNSDKTHVPMDLIARIKWKKPYPIIRAHFGLPNLEKTIKGIKILAESKVLDVISIAPDQNTQANYFHPEERVKELSGAGGVPLNSEEDFLNLNRARLCGNYPLLRIYAGTRDFIKLASLVRQSSIQKSHFNNSCRSLSDSSGKVKFILVGDGISRGNIQKLISQLKLEQDVFLTGWRQDISRILSAIDVFVLTSLWEGLPISVLEAMAASVPVIVSDTGGVAELVCERKTGFLALPGDIETMADRLRDLLADAELRRQIGQNARVALGSEFTTEAMLKNTENLYQGILKTSLFKSN